MGGVCQRMHESVRVCWAVAVPKTFFIIEDIYRKKKNLQWIITIAPTVEVGFCAFSTKHNSSYFHTINQFVSPVFLFAHMENIPGFSCRNGTRCVRRTFQTNTHQRTCRTSGQLVDVQAAVLVQSRGASQIDDLQTCTPQPTATAERR